MRQLGFRQTGVWRGTVRLVGEPKRVLRLHVDFVARVGNLRRFVGDGRVSVQGQITVEDRVNNMPFDGELVFQPGQHRPGLLKLTFKDRLEREFVLSGEMRIELLHLRETLGRFLIRIEEEGDTTMLGSMSLEVRDIPSWLKSFSPTLRDSQ